MACEITVKLKNPMKSLTRVSVIHHKPIMATENDPIVADFINFVSAEFNDIAQKKTVTIKLIEE